MKTRTTINAQITSSCLGFMNSEDNEEKNARTTLNHLNSVSSSESKAVGIFSQGP